MERQISLWSFRLGLLCVILTVLLRGLAIFGVFPNLVPAMGAPVSYNTFLRGGVLLLVLSIASSLMSNRGGTP